MKRKWQISIHFLSRFVFLHQIMFVTIIKSVQNQYRKKQKCLSTDFCSSHGMTSAFIMDECWNNYHTVLYFHKNENSELLDKFNPLIDRLREAGMPDKWKRDEMDRVARLASDTGDKTGLDRRPLGLRNLAVAFSVLGLGLALSVLSFFGEQIFSCWGR